MAGTPITRVPARCSASSAPGNVGSSTATGWPGRTSLRISRSRACCAPVVTTTWAALDGSRSRSVRWRAVAARSAGSPCGKYPLVWVTAALSAR